MAGARAESKRYASNCSCNPVLLIVPTPFWIRKQTLYSLWARLSNLGVGMVQYHLLPESGPGPQPASRSSNAGNLPADRISLGHWQRSQELGLRRADGGKKSRIAAQLLGSRTVQKSTRRWRPVDSNVCYSPPFPLVSSPERPTPFAVCWPRAPKGTSQESKVDNIRM